MIKYLILLLLLAGCAQPPVGGEVNIEKEFHDHDIFEQYSQANGTTIEETKEFFQNTHGIDEEKNIFANLPPPNPQFLEWKSILNGGDGNALGETPENAYLQPEFYPTFETSGIQTWIHAPSIPTFSLGLNGTPGIQEATINQPTADFNTTLFITAAWGSTVHQGMRLRYKVVPSALIHLDFEPSEFVIGPSFPTFHEKWAQKVIVRGTMNNVPEGEYHVYILPALPNPIEANQWKEEGHTPYVNAEGSLYSDTGIGELIIKVTQEN
jgi:hypothetical protein